MASRDYDTDIKPEHDESEVAINVERQRQLTKTLLLKVDTRRVKPSVRCDRMAAANIG